MVNEIVLCCLYYLLLGACCLFQFQEGTRLPTIYAFALVENCQNDRFRLRMYLSGEVEHSNRDVVQPCQRLLSMRALITSPTSEVDKLFYSLKVTFSS